MRGTNYGVGFGIAIFFLVGGIVLYVGGGSLIGFDSGTEAGNDTADSTMKMIGAIWAGVALFLILLFAALLARARSRARLARTGTPGKATVREAEQTGTYVNYNPQMKLRLDVQTDDGMPPFEKTTRAVVPMTALGRFGLGTELPVRVDPQDRERFEILWDELPPPVAQAGAGGEGAEQRLETLDRLRKEGAISDTEYEAKRKQIIAGI
jgi:putative oligomerization/nucleic acid binding protein